MTSDRPEPLAMYHDRPVTIQFRAGHKPASSSLISYLALSYTAVATPSKALRLGALDALRISFDAARTDLADPKDLPIAPVAFKQWTAWLNSPEYLAARTSFIAQHPEYSKLAGVSKTKLTTKLDPTGWLDQEHCAIVLDVANASLGTNFQLGWIRDGHWCQWNSIEHTFAYQYRRNALGRLVKGPSLRNGVVVVNETPVIWILNTNVEERDSDWNQPKKNLDSWEGLAVPDDTDGELEKRRQQVYDFGLGRVLDHDLPHLYILLKDYTSNDHPLHLDALKGCFLRTSRIEKPGPHPKTGYRYMKAANGNGGIVAEEHMRKLEGKKFRPTTATDPTEEDLLPGRKTRHTSLDGVFSRFNIVRAVEALDKAGNPENANFIEGFKFENGDFFFDTSRRREEVDGVTGWSNWVHDIKGKWGFVEARRLQRIDNAWGVKQQLPFSLFEAAISNDLTLEEYQESATYFGVWWNTDSTREQIYKALAQKKIDNEWDFSMFRMTKDYTADDVNALVPFTKGEVVMVVRRQPGGPDIVRDFEGYEATIPRDGFELITNDAWGAALSLNQYNKMDIFLPPRSTFGSRDRGAKVVKAARVVKAASAPGAQAAK